jgi:uncharacterized protein (AIM24 family)
MPETGDQSPSIRLPVEASGDEDFLYHLYRGGELLATGKTLEARDELERAFQLRPENPKAQNLLGLVYFKLGLLERAAEVYYRLVQDNPSDATLRVNLGLVYLKAGQVDQAIRELEAALTLSPQHPRALNYLGLAYARLDQPTKARSAFERAGNRSMVRKLEESFPYGDPTQRLRSPAGETPSLKDPAPADPTKRRAPSEAGSPPPSVTDENPPAPGGDLFRCDGPTVHLDVRGELRSRLTGLLWLRGELSRSEEPKRVRGRPTSQPFGEGADRLFRLTGQGDLVVSTQGLVFTPLRLDDEAAYFVERSVFALEGPLSYENGRVPNTAPEDLLLVHVQGRGSVLLRSSGVPTRVAVTPTTPLLLPSEQLVGWIGALTPRGSPVRADDSGPHWVRLEGEGWALLSLPPGSR